MSGRPRIGVDLGGTKIEAVALDPEGKVLVRRRVRTPRDDYGLAVRTICDLVEELEDELGTEGSVGIGTPGAISPASGLIKNSNSAWLNGRPLAQDLEWLVKRPLRVANDADCFALSEATDGAGRDASTVFGVILGTGVGGGIVVDGRLVRGPNAISGEWGHNPLPWIEEGEWPGPSCYCGMSGCIERFLSGPGMSWDHQMMCDEQLEAIEIAQRAGAGDRNAEATLERYEGRLARALAGVINVIDPEVIVLGGGLSNVERLYANTPKLWQRWVFSDRVDTRLLPPQHGDSSGVLGAAHLWD